MQDNLLIVISCKIQKQIIYFQHIMLPNTDSGHSEEMMSQSKTERQQRKFQTL